MKRLLVTGASGFMGSRVVDFYRGKYEICAPGHGEMDITEEAEVISGLRDWRPDYVVHCAAISDIGRCEQEPERSLRINVDGAVNLAKASALVGAKMPAVQLGSGICGKYRHRAPPGDGKSHAGKPVRTGEASCGGEVPGSKS